MRPFATFGVILIVFGAFGLLFSVLAYSALGSECVGVRACTGPYPGWFELRIAIWGVFGLVLIAFGALLLWRGSRRGRFRSFGPGGPYGPAGPYRGPGGRRWANAGGYGPRFCPRCQARNGPGFQFCHSCGAPLGPPVGVPAGAPVPPQ